MHTSKMNIAGANSAISCPLDFRPLARYLISAYSIQTLGRFNRRPYCDRVQACRHRSRDGKGQSTSSQICTHIDRIRAANERNIIHSISSRSYFTLFLSTPLFLPWTYIPPNCQVATLLRDRTALADSCFPHVIRRRALTSDY